MDVRSPKTIHRPQDGPKEGLLTMQNLIKESLARNGGNGSAAINARGISHRGWTPEQRAAAAADAVLGATCVIPSIGQAATAFGVSPYSVRRELKTREAAAERERHAEYARQRALPIVSAWDHATPQGRAEAFRLIGVANVWDVLSSVVG
jgi:hypothetical protein